MGEFEIREGEKVKIEKIGYSQIEDCLLVLVAAVLRMTIFFFFLDRVLSTDYLLFPFPSNLSKNSFISIISPLGSLKNSFVSFLSPNGFFFFFAEQY